MSSELQHAGNAGSFADAPTTVFEDGAYRLRFVRTEADLEKVLRLRFEVFNLELAEGLASSLETGLDEDPFDRGMDHLLVEDRRTDRTIGTYRVQTPVMAAAHGGFYSAGLFQLDALPEDVRNASVELGRACIAAEHRNTKVLFLLWRGLAAYVARHQARFLFGCCSLTTQDPEVGRHAAASLAADGHIHPDWSVPAASGHACPAGPIPDGPFNLPKLFRTYLRHGAKVCSSPSIDADFQTIDFLVLFDVAAMDKRTFGRFFG